MGSVYSKGGYLYHQYTELVGSKRVRRQVALEMTDTPENRRKAEIIKNETHMRINAPREILSHYYPLESAFNEFLMTKKTLSRASKDLYHTAFERFTDVVGILHCSEVTQTHVNEFYDALEALSPNTRATYFRYMISFFNYLKKKRYIKEVFFTRQKSTPKRIRPIPEDVFEKILERTNNKNQRLLLEFLWLSGFRKVEAIKLRWEDLDWEQGIIYVQGKGVEDQLFPFYSSIQELLRPHKRLKGSVFGYKSVHSIKFWGRIRKAVGHTYSIHDIRKTFACSLVENGVDIKTASQLLRHSSVKVTERYYAKVSLKRMGDEAERAVSKKKIQELKVVNLSSK